MRIENATVVVAVAHPDDEVLGMGGTILRLVENGCKVYLVIYSKGVSSRNTPRESEEARIISAENASKILGISKIIWGNFPDNQFDSINLLQINKWISEIVETYRPSYLFTHHLHDLNIDHRLVAESCLVAARPRSTSSIKGLFNFEIPSSTNWAFKLSTFSPTFFVDITQYENKKMSALDCYRAELDNYPNTRSPRGIQALASYRGTTVGVENAEGFEVSLIVDK